MDIFTLAAGLLLPWVLGLAALLALPWRKVSLDAPGEIAWMAGAGYLVGAFLLTLWMRALSIAGVPFGPLAIAMPLVVAAAAMGYVAWRRNGNMLTQALRTALRGIISPRELAGARLLAWRLLLAWIAIRLALLGLEVAWRPLYPWDSWIQWATKARVWYELGRVVPFARPDAWLAAGGAMYVDAAPEYPPTMPLLQVWACIALGRWDDSLMNWPWWQVAAALALAVYGGLRRLGVTALGALVGMFFVGSLPLANVHVALAGYADLPMAAYYTVAVLAFLHWCETRDAHDAGLALLLALACTQIKNPGVVWALTLVPGVVVALLPRHGLKLVAMGFVAAAFLLVVLARTRPTVLGYQLYLDFDPAWRALGDSYFLLANWHLLWYGVLAAALLAWRQLLAPALVPLTVIVAAGLLFLFVVFGFTNARAWVADQTTVNRATLHLAPLMVVFVILAFRAFAQRWAASHPVAASGSPDVKTQSPL